MKNIGLILLLMLATPLFADVMGNASQATPKQPVYIDCHPDEVVLYPGSTKVTWEALQQTNNPVTQLLGKIEAHSRSFYVVILARPGSVKVFRMIRKMASQYPIDMGDDVIDADFDLDAQFRLEQDSPEHPHAFRFNKPRTAVIGKQPAYFECRQTEVFFVDHERLNTQAEKLLSTATSGGMTAFNQAIAHADIGNEYYKVIPQYLLTMVVALEPRPDIHGEKHDQFEKTDSKFQIALTKLDPKKQYIHFLLRNDGFGAFHAAHLIAKNKGFDTVVELLGTDEPIKIGSGGQVIE